MNISISLGQNSKDWVDYFSAISPFLIGVFTLLFYFWNAKKQKEQWLNDALIKNELKVLLEMKNLLLKSDKAIEWFFVFVLPDFICDNSFTDDDILEKDEFIKQLYFYHPEILNVYNFFRENYYIFKKYEIADSLKITELMLSIANGLDCEKYESVETIIDQEIFEDKKTGQKIPIEKFRYKFMDYTMNNKLEWIKRNRSDLLNVKETCKNKCKDNCEKCTILEVALQIMERDLYFLKHKLDKMLCYSNDKILMSREEELGLFFFKIYENLKNKKMTVKEQRERKKFKEKILKAFEEKIESRQDVENDL